MEQILIPVIGLKKLPYINPGKMDMISPYNLNKEADINSCNKYRETSLHKACKVGHDSIVQHLLNKDAATSFLYSL